MKYVGYRSENSWASARCLIFWIPLSNPIPCQGNAWGVFPGTYGSDCGTMMNLGVERGMVVSGEDNMDEITLTGETTVSEIKDGK